MKDNNVIKTKMGKVQAIGLSLVYLLVMLYLLSGCGSSHSVVVKDCCSHSGVECTSVSDTKVNLDLVSFFRSFEDRWLSGIDAISTLC